MLELARHLLLLLLCAGFAVGARAEHYRLSVATGGVTGTYYQLGAAICRLLKDHPPAHPMDCAVEGTAGAVRNLIDMRFGNVPMALVQADSLYFAKRGEGPFAAAGPDRQTRAMFTFLTETLNVLTRTNEPTPNVGALRGRRINIGAPGSGTEVTFRRLMAERGWSDADFAGFTDFRSTLQADALCRGRTDAIVFVAGNPSGGMQDATFTCDARLVPIADAFVRAVGTRFPYYVPAVIPGGTYRNNPEPVPTLGVRATLVAARDTPDEVVYEVTKVVLDHLDELRRLHLSFTDIRLEGITRHCVFAPLHAGTVRYLRERRLSIEVCPELQAGLAG
jgi:TRAP transporter TAXI family solute receptor